MKEKRTLKRIIDPSLADEGMSLFAERLVELVEAEGINNYIFLRLFDFDENGDGRIEAAVSTKSKENMPHPHYELLKSCFSTIYRHHSEAHSSPTPPPGTYAYRQALAYFATQFAMELMGEVGNEED